MTNKLPPCRVCGSKDIKIVGTVEPMVRCNQCSLRVDMRYWERLRLAPEPREGKTVRAMVRVRAAVCVNSAGEYTVTGSAWLLDDEAMEASEVDNTIARCFIEAYIPIPEINTVEARVVEADDAD